VTDAIPELSVVIAAYNAVTTLDAQLEALSRQKVPFPWEILVCDNGSTDGTVDLVRSWEQRLPALALVDASSRRGPGAARNVGARSARAPLIAFCDADDVVADNWVTEMRTVLETNDFVTGANDFTQLHDPRSLSPSRLADSLITMPYWPQFKASGAGNMGIVAAAFAEVGGFDESLPTGEDVDLCWRLQLAGRTLVRCETVVVHVRKRRGLRAVYWQAYSYGVGHRLLKAKYAKLIADYWQGRQAAPPTPGSGRRPARIFAAVLRRLRPNGLADSAWQFGEWRAGRRRETDSYPSPLELPTN